MEGAPTLHSERISDRSEEYREIREKMRETVPDSAMIYGEELITDLENTREILKNIEGYLAEETDEKEIEKLLDHKLYFEQANKKRLSNFKEKLKKTKPRDAFPFFETVSTPYIEISLRIELPWLNKIENFTAKHLMVCTLNEEISDRLFEKMVRLYVNFWEKMQEEFHERAPYILADFKEKASQAIKENKLPITEEYLEERMGETRIYLGDNMRLGECINGDYSVEEGAIRVAYRENEKAQEKTVFHEMIHALSGRTVRFHDGDLDHQRVGLRFGVYDTKGKWVDKRFRWLNEAVTEEIAIELSEADPEDHSYDIERKYLQDLYDQGVSKELIYQAYFENYDPNSEDKVPKWKELIHHIKDKQPEISDSKGSVEYLKKVEEEIKREKDQFIEERDSSN